MEKYARLAAGASLAAERCGGFVGGYSSARDLRRDADTNAALARKLGATDQTMQKARTDVEAAFGGALILGGTPAACNQLVSSIAWESS
jgi:hypothetical protein